jgi:hypothetical protein
LLGRYGHYARHDDLADAGLRLDDLSLNPGGAHLFIGQNNGYVSNGSRGRRRRRTRNRRDNRAQKRAKAKEN